MIDPSDKLLDVIYDAATEPDLWREALTMIADRTNSQGGILFGQSFGAGKVYFAYNGRLSEECNRAYQERHVRNPWNEAMYSRPVGPIVFSDEIVPLSSLRSTAFFDEVLRPQDVAHNAMIPLAYKDGFTAAFNLCRSARQGPFGEPERQLLGWLAPHMRRSIQLAFRLDGYRTLQQASFDVLDRFSAGIILLDRRKRIVYINAAARALGADGGPLLLRHATIAAHAAAHTQRLGELIHAAVEGLPTASMSVPRADDGRLLTILVSSVRGRDIGRFADNNMPDAAVMLFIVDPADREGIPPAWIMDAYGLTQAEARVAIATLSAASIFEAAVHLGLSPNTVKTHLRNVFVKTGTNRQADLGRLIATIGLIKNRSAERG